MDRCRIRATLNPKDQVRISALTSPWALARPREGGPRQGWPQSRPRKRSRGPPRGARRGRTRRRSRRIAIRLLRARPLPGPPLRAHVSARCRSRSLRREASRQMRGRPPGAERGSRPPGQPGRRGPGGRPRSGRRGVPAQPRLRTRRARASPRPDRSPRRGGPGAAPSPGPRPCRRRASPIQDQAFPDGPCHEHSDARKQLFLRVIGPRAVVRAKTRSSRPGGRRRSHR